MVLDEIFHGLPQAVGGFRVVQSFMLCFVYCWLSVGYYFILPWHLILFSTDKFESIFGHVSIFHLFFDIIYNLWRLEACCTVSKSFNLCTLCGFRNSFLPQLKIEKNNNIEQGMHKDTRIQVSQSLNVSFITIRKDEYMRQTKRSTAGELNADWLWKPQDEQIRSC